MEPVHPPVFTGVGVALVTLFQPDGALDAAATAALADRLVTAGVRAVIVAGTTGEAFSLTAEERVFLLGAVRESVGSRVPVLAGTGASTTPQAAAFTADAVAHGADGVLVLSPPGTSDPRHYYRRVVEAAEGRPVLAYHFPAVSAPGIAVERLPQLGVDGLKDSTGDPERLLQELEVFPGPIYTGSSALLSFAGPLGCAGAILSLANVEPEGCAQAFAGDAAAQRRLTAAHLASREDFPRGLKKLVATRFGVSTVTRTGS